MRWIKRLFHYCRNRFRYSNFFTKMVALFLVAAFLPLFVCSAFLVTDTIQVSGKNTAASIRNNFQQTYTSLENRLTQVKKCADLLLNDAGINDFLRNGKNETTFWEQRTFKTDMDNTISFIENAQNIKRLRVYVDPAYFYILDSYHYCSMNMADKYDGKVPEDRDELQTLPGVGRKTANVVVSNAFGQDAIAVDTHVFRVANRLGLVHAKDVKKTEEQLMEHIPQEQWSIAHHWLIWHGRRVCSARNPKCQGCPCEIFCEFAHKQIKKADTKQKQTKYKGI